MVQGIQQKCHKVTSGAVFLAARSADVPAASPARSGLGRGTKELRCGIWASLWWWRLSLVAPQHVGS